MRMSDKDEDLVGKICVCSVGRVAIVTGRQTQTYQGKSHDVYVGLGLDGKGTWGQYISLYHCEDCDGVSR